MFIRGYILKWLMNDDEDMWLIENSKPNGYCLNSSMTSSCMLNNQEECWKLITDIFREYDDF